MTTGVLASPSADHSKNAISSTSTTLIITSREEALQLVKEQYKGKVLKVQPSSFNGSAGYKVKMLSEKGVVFNVSVEAQTGNVLRN